MTYTRNNLYVGAIFGANGHPGYLITAIDDTNCQFYNVDAPIEKYLEYSIQIIVDCLNNGTWKLKQQNYDIY